MAPGYLSQATVGRLNRIAQRTEAHWSSHSLQMGIQAIFPRRAQLLSSQAILVLRSEANPTISILEFFER